MAPPLLMCSLYFSFAMNLFRVVMYIVNLNGATTVKVTKQAWEDLNIREVMFTHTRFIRKFMTYRTMICGWAIMMLEEGPALHSLCVLQVAFDLYLMCVIVYKANDRSIRVMKHQNIYAPASLQALLCAVSVGCLVAHHFSKH
jgi:hypothetical protein